MPYSIAELARLLSLPYRGAGSALLRRASSWSDADAGSLVYWDGSAGRDQKAPPRAACVLAPPAAAAGLDNAIVSENPKLDFARAAALLAPPATGSGLRHPDARIAPDADLAADADVHAHVVVDSGARVGSKTILHAGVVLGRDARVGAHCVLHPRVVLYPGAVLGDRVVLHAGVVIGADGFGYVFDGRAQVKFPQLGRVVIEDDVEIGANSAVDRGSLGVTRVGQGSKIDNLVQIAHNVDIGRGVVIAAQTGISGSTVIGDFAIIGGQVGFGDHARVEAGAVIGSKAGVLPGKIVRGGEVYWGVPVRPLRTYKRLNALFGRLPELKSRLEELEAETGRLREAIDRLKKSE